MQPVIEIHDPHDPRVADYLGLTDVVLRTRLEPPHGLFIAEGELVIRRALATGYRPRSLLLSSTLTTRDDLAAAGAAAGAPVYLGTPEVLERITGFHVHRGALGAFARRSLPDPAALLARAGRVAVLEDITSTTNLGAIFRCAAALGIDAVLLNPTCADPLYRRSVRVSMGQVLVVPSARLPGWPDSLERVRAAGFTLLALTPAPDAEPLQAVRPAPTDRLAVLLGSEGPGLSAAALAAADRRVRITMTAGVDSLNVAAAAAIAFWELGARPPG